MADTESFEEEVERRFAHLRFIIGCIVGVLVAVSFTLMAIGYFTNNSRVDKLIDSQARRSYVGGYIQCGFKGLGDWIDKIDDSLTEGFGPRPPGETPEQFAERVSAKLDEAKDSGALFKAGNDPKSPNVCPDLKYLIESGNPTKEPK